MYLKTFDDMKKTSAFFMLKPVNAIYGFIVTVCLAIVAVIIWACLAPMDDVVKASVLLRPSQAVSSIKCVTSGELSVKNFENDDIVQEGDLLFSLDTTALKTELESYRLAQKKNLENLHVYKILAETISSSKLETEEDDTDAYLKSKSYLLEKSRYETMVEDARVKYEREKDAPAGLRVPQTIADLENQYRQTKLSYETWLSNQSIQTNEKVSSLETERKSYESRISELERAIKNSTIYAPISGRISEVTKFNSGDYILAGEEVLKIVPQENEALRADIYVDPSYVARVKVGNPVKIKFPGLAPSRYGMVETEVSLVPPDVTLTATGQAAFVVEAVIVNPYLRTKQGQTARLLPGITAEARIVTERSTAMQMVLRKLDFIN
jgi:adhesin transport system membrane fusion protein